jgi:hypothetical protein
MALSASEGFLLDGLIDIIALKLFCYDVSKWIMLGILGIILFINFGIFYNTGKGSEIVKQKPSLLGSRKISIFFVLTFFLISISWLFWGPIYAKHILNPVTTRV